MLPVICILFACGVAKRKQISIWQEMGKNIRELVGSLQDYRVLGSMDRCVSKPSPIDEAEENSLSFYARAKEQALQSILSSKASVIVCPDDIEFPELESKTLIQVPNPRLAFARLSKLFETLRTGNKKKRRLL